MAKHIVSTRLGPTLLPHSSQFSLLYLFLPLIYATNLTLANQRVLLSLNADVIRYLDKIKVVSNSNLILYVN